MSYAHIPLVGEINPDTVGTTELMVQVKALAVIYDTFFPEGYPIPQVISAIYYSKSREDGGSIKPVTIAVARMN